MNKEKRFSEKMHCGHCNYRAPMEIVASFDKSYNVLDDEGEYAFSEGYLYELLLCPSCDQTILRRRPWSENWESPGEFELLFPSIEKPILGLPDSVKKAYVAASKVRQVDVNSFAVLLGRVLEIICQDRNAKGDSLYNKLKYLSDKGEMPSRLVEMANSLRQLRNIGAHADLGELSDEEVPVLDGLCRAILEYVYSAPQLIETVQARLNKISKESVNNQK